MLNSRNNFCRSYGRFFSRMVSLFVLNFKKDRNLNQTGLVSLRLKYSIKTFLRIFEHCVKKDLYLEKYCSEEFH